MHINQNLKRGEIMEHEYASKGQANLNTVLGAIGTAGATGILNGVGGILGGMNGGCSEDHCVNRYELGLQQEIASKDSKIALLEANIYVDSKIADVYERLNGRINCVESQLAEQRVYNATNTATMSCYASQIAQLMALTKLVVPITSVCPEPAVATA